MYFLRAPGLPRRWRLPYYYTPLISAEALLAVAKAAAT